MTWPERLAGLRCAVCKARDHLWLDPVRGIVECRRCGQSALVAPSEIDACTSDDRESV